MDEPELPSMLNKILKYIVKFAPVLVYAILQAVETGDTSELQTIAKKLFQNILNESGISPKLRSDFNKLLEQLKNPNDILTRSLLILEFYENNKDTITEILESLRGKSNKTSIKKYLDPLNFVKNKYNQYKKKALKKKILEKEAKFIKNNKEKKEKKNSNINLRINLRIK